jgi:hypothetical protein
MTAAKTSPYHPIPPYGIAMTEAIASGDVSQMSAARDAAFTHMASIADVARLLPELEKAIQAKGAIIRPLYAVTIQDAKARGDTAELARIKDELHAYAGMLNLPVATGNTSVANAAITPYGVAIQDAKARGDEAEVKRLTAVAESLLAQLHASK